MRVCRVARRHTRDPWSFCRRAPSAASCERSGEPVGRGRARGRRTREAYASPQSGGLCSNVKPLPISKGQLDVHHTRSGSRGRGFARIGTSEPVEDVTAERMPHRYAGVIEVVGVVVGHAETLHDPPRAEVRGHGEGHDLLQAELVEAHGDGGLGGLGRVPAAPVLPRETPAHLDRRREMRLERRRPEADEADERATPGISTAQRPKPRASKWASIRSTSASDARRSLVEGKYSMTAESAFSAANAGRSLSRQRRMSSRSVRRSFTAFG